MTKPMRAGSAASQSAGELQLKTFKAQMKQWGFKKLTAKGKIKIIYGKKKQAPKRVTEENILQLAYVCKLANGYDICIWVGVIDGRLTISGYPWIHIRNSKEERMASWKFFKNNVADLLKRLAAYAHYAKAIASGRPEGCKLVEVSFHEFEWQDRDGNFFSKVNPIVPLGQLGREDGKIVKAGERARKYYWNKTEGTGVKRFKDTTSTWKK